jgi:hypothetical protein
MTRKGYGNGTQQKVPEINRKFLNRKLRKSTESSGNHQKVPKINRKFRKSTESSGNQQKVPEINRMYRKSMESYGNQWKTLKSI